MKLAADRLARVSLELGGKSANIVLADADVPAAVAANLDSLCSNAGQTCSAWSRLIVDRSRYDEVVDLLRVEMDRFSPGDPTNPETRMGPLASRGQTEVVASYVAGAVRDGATAITIDGYEPPAEGHYHPPYVFTDVDPRSVLAQEEVFGPVLAVFAVDSEDEAVELANDSSFGLSGAVWSGDDDHSVDVARRVRTGQLEVNGGAFNILAPFGGYKQSGLGRELGTWGMEEFFETKAIQLPQRSET